MNIEIQNKIEATELCLALKARMHVLNARQRSGKERVYPAQHEALNRLFEQASNIDTSPLAK
jgi:hypothetical protein